MGSAVRLLKAIKQTVIDTLNAQKLTEICYGKVVSAAPLKISVEQKMTLTKAQLVLCRNVTEFETEISVDCCVENAENHSHALKGKKKITVHNGLAVGDEVMLLRQQGGQKFIVWDRLT